MAEETKEAGLEPAVDGEPGTAPPASVPSASGGLAQRLARRGFRPEEVAIAITLVLGVGICLATGTGFETSEVFWGYLRYFGAYLLYLFTSSTSSPSCGSSSSCASAGAPRAGSAAPSSLGWAGRAAATGCSTPTSSSCAASSCF